MKSFLKFLGFLAGIAALAAVLYIFQDGTPKAAKHALELLALLEGKSSKPTPRPLATPLPTPTPVPATPEPIPTPVPATPVPATPVPAPTPDPNDPQLVLQSIANSRDEWPAQVMLKKREHFPVMINGAVAGSLEVPPNVPISLLAYQNGKVTLGLQAARKELNASETDLVERVLANRRLGTNKPSVPEVDSTPPAETASASPTPQPRKRPFFEDDKKTAPIPVPEIPKSVAAGYKLVWQDEFDGKELDMQKWKDRRDGKWRDGYYDKDGATLDGKGQLHINVTKVGDEFHTGMISTEKSFQTKFGYYECRARLQVQPGFWSAFWLQGKNVNAVSRGAPDDSRVNGVECDIFEYLARQPNGFQHAMHWGGYGELHKSKAFRVKEPKVHAGWHTYGVEWRPDGYTFYLDGEKTWDFNDPVSQTEQYIILSVEIGPWGGDIKEAKLPDDVAFDYVRVWQKPDSDTASAATPAPMNQKR